MKTQFCELTFLTVCIWGMCVPLEHARNKRSYQMHRKVWFFMFLQAWGEGVGKEVRLKLSRKYQPRLLLPLREKSGRLKAVMKTPNIKDPNNMKPNKKTKKKTKNHWELD